MKKVVRNSRSFDIRMQRPTSELGMDRLELYDIFNLAYRIFNISKPPLISLRTR